MHVAGKVFLGLGAVFLLLGIVMAGLGGNALEEVGDVDVEEKSRWNGMNGDFYYDNTDEIMVFVRDTVRCDEFTVKITNESGEDVWKADECTSDGSMPAGYQDDPGGWYHMGSFGWDQTEGDLEIEASDEVYLLGLWDVVGEELGEAAGGIMGILGGVGLSGCGVCFLLLGGILAVALNDPKEATQMQQPPSV
ncbi:MAG TPA: hypothetical protein EYQ15_04325 [Candidatus Poseidoniales archaeon]|nr:MAG: hypothetical protein CXT65_04475 [Euryarchaeota archaeon]HIG38513.1 hypothetical protein [Candidatus Poseidoniales archaeon]HIL44268.1 hypothetical protein [Candidatus Poseidoniales archaeon]